MVQQTNFDEYLESEQFRQWVGKELARISYKPNWFIELVHPMTFPFALVNDVSIKISFHVPDVEDPKTVITVGQRFVVPSTIMSTGKDKKKLFYIFVRNCIRDLEIHELDEWFKVDSRQLQNPHKQVSLQKVMSDVDGALKMFKGGASESYSVEQENNAP